MRLFTTENHIAYRLRIESGTPIRITARTEDGRVAAPEDWKPFLYFWDKESFFGMTAETDGADLLMSTAEFVRLFQQPPHHYVSFGGERDEDRQLLERARDAADRLNDPALWDAARTEDGRIVIDESYAAPEVRSFLENAVTQQFEDRNLSPAQLPSVRAFLKGAGWDGLPESEEIVVGMRLSEPEETSRWTLETVIRSKRGSVYWTPAPGKRNASIADALPAKWKDYTDGIRRKQGLMLTLCPVAEEAGRDGFYSAEPEGPDRFFAAELTDLDVLAFLREDAELLQAFGIELSLPAWLRAVQESKVRVRADIGSPVKKQSAVGLDELVKFDWQFSLNGHEMSRRDFEQLVEENRQFIRIGGEWVRVDSALLRKIRELIEEADGEDWTIKDLLFKDLPDVASPEEELESDDPLVEFRLNRSLQELLDRLLEKRDLPETPIPGGLQTELRPYQKTGFDYLVFMRDQGFGLCLADDMGLGKTVQLISYLLHVHDGTRNEPSLIICPTSVLGNWQKELERFAPGLRVVSHYGGTRAKPEDFRAFLDAEKPDVVLSTYGIASSDAEAVQSVNWTSVTLDEAQNIKNVQTKQSRVLRKLKGDHHIALTGTPIENRLSELWAIFDFINKGYLYRIGRFKEQFIVPIERDDSEAHKEKLRRRIQPFLLRRTKKDPELQLNLPEKQEQLEYCPLTAEQAALYEGLVQETLGKMEALSGFERKGLVLKMLSKLKQLCNHPALYLKEPYTSAGEILPRSQKLERIVSMAGDVAERGEQCLIFTQYIGMGHFLQEALSELYGFDVPFLTGGMPKAKRDALVAAFQAGEFPVFVLSLKAGGTGLNLTAATHVLHADRWWNPAVENQATDRAYRIGQTQFVHVHKFVTIGTVEEKIDKLLAEKQAMSDQFIQSSQWMTELSDAELEDLFTYTQ
ncbi:DEAD/DEAH box helicase [Indiicoccus explosivorum]|uniref:DEAD/DEAH box helicase n=1 Tax=Indiicoccus explosivorum TaxID=1917864 RepID=UPI000B42DE33|nr:DEAD/DEAH box helicase [Indiicoccus explosivorum]